MSDYDVYFCGALGFLLFVVSVGEYTLIASCHLCRSCVLRPIHMLARYGDIKHLKYYSIAFWPALRGHWNAVAGAVLEFREQVIGNYLSSSCWLWPRMGGLWELVSNSGLDSSTVSKRTNHIQL
jgi:hypothetical protein